MKSSRNPEIIFFSDCKQLGLLPTPVVRNGNGTRNGTQNKKKSLLDSIQIDCIQFKFRLNFSFFYIVNEKVNFFLVSFYAAFHQKSSVQWSLKEALDKFTLQQCCVTICTVSHLLRPLQVCFTTSQYTVANNRCGIQFLFGGGGYFLSIRDNFTEVYLKLIQFSSRT